MPALTVLFVAEVAPCVGTLFLLGAPPWAAFLAGIPLAYLLGRGFLHAIGKSPGRPSRRGRKREWVAVPLR